LGLGVAFSVSEQLGIFTDFFFSEKSKRRFLFSLRVFILFNTLPLNLICFVDHSVSECRTKRTRIDTVTRQTRIVIKAQQALANFE
jgi:hypothetical protein